MTTVIQTGLDGIHTLAQQPQNGNLVELIGRSLVTPQSIRELGAAHPWDILDFSAFIGMCMNLQHVCIAQDMASSQVIAGALLQRLVNGFPE